MFRFPWSNFHELNLDWILEVVKEAKEIFVNGRSDIDNAVSTANEALEVAEQAAAAVIADGAITIPKLNNEFLKTTAYVIVGNRAEEPIPAGAYVYLRKSEVAGLSDGIYTAASNIPANAIVTPAEFQQSTELHDAGALNVLKNTFNTVEAGLAIIVTGDTCASPVPVGGYAYIKNNTHGLVEGLYANTSAAVFPTSGGTADISVFTAVSGGGFNSLNSKLSNLGETFSNATAGNGVTIVSGGYMKIGHIVVLSIRIKTTTTHAINDILLTNIPGTGFAQYFALETGYDMTSYGARTGANGALYANTALPTDTEFSINGVYVEFF